MQGQPGTRLLHAAEVLAQAAAARDHAEYTTGVAAAVAALPLASLVQSFPQDPDPGAPLQSTIGRACRLQVVVIVLRLVAKRLCASC